MRLINVKTLELEEYYSAVPPYAILSHTWGRDEVSFSDWKDLEQARKKEGFLKIELTCRQAATDGLGYAWVDTSCIDKSSSAELSEAINSMYAWYQYAQVCYAFLADVSVGEGVKPIAFDAVPEMPTDLLARCTDPAVEQAFMGSAWFTRGWTLQELLAPSKVMFFSREWRLLGARNDHPEMISEITGIDAKYLEHRENVQECMVAERMSWMAGRRTTRVEDMAYALMGLFDIHMALLYGEGTHAFLRLQKEIIARSNDQSIFCWQPPPEQDVRFYRYGCEDTLRSVLAASPRLFRERHLLRAAAAAATTTTTTATTTTTTGTTTTTSLVPYTITNVGLSVSLPVLYTAFGVYALLDLLGMVTEEKRGPPWQVEYAQSMFLPLFREANGRYVRMNRSIFLSTMPLELRALLPAAPLVIDCTSSNHEPAFNNAHFTEAKHARAAAAAAAAASRLDPFLERVHSALLLAFREPVQIQVMQKKGADFSHVLGAVVARQHEPGIRCGALLKLECPTSAETYVLLVAGRWRAPTVVEVAKGQGPVVEWALQTSSYCGVDRAGEKTYLQAGVDYRELESTLLRLPADFFGSWYRQEPLVGVRSWEHTDIHQTVCCVVSLRHPGTAGRTTGRMTGRMADRVAGRVAGWTAGWTAGRTAGGGLKLDPVWERDPLDTLRMATTPDPAAADWLATLHRRRHQPLKNVRWSVFRGFTPPWPQGSVAGRIKQKTRKIADWSLTWTWWRWSVDALCGK